MKLGVTVKDVREAKRLAETRILDAIRDFQHITELDVHAVEIRGTQYVGDKLKHIQDVDLDVRFP